VPLLLITYTSSHPERFPVLGYNTVSEVSDEQKKFDNKFVTVIVIIALIAVALIVADRNYLHVGYLTPIGLIIGVLVLIANLIKGNIDWRKKKKRQEAGELRKTTESAKTQLAAEKVASLKPKTLKRDSRDGRDYTALDGNDANEKSIVPPAPVKKQEEATLVPIIEVAPADDIAVSLARSVDDDSRD
jgi:hypothetical protein